MRRTLSSPSSTRFNLTTKQSCIQCFWKTIHVSSNKYNTNVTMFVRTRWGSRYFPPVREKLCSFRSVPSTQLGSSSSVSSASELALLAANLNLSLSLSLSLSLARSFVALLGQFSSPAYYFGSPARLLRIQLSEQSHPGQQQQPQHQSRSRSQRSNQSRSEPNERVRDRQREREREREKPVGKPKRPAACWTGSSAGRQLAKLNTKPGLTLASQSSSSSWLADVQLADSTDKLSWTWPGNLALVFILAVVVVSAGLQALLCPIAFLAFLGRAG